MKKTFQTESDLQKYCLKYVKHLTKLGEPIYAINIPSSSFGKRGVSDILLCVDGHFVAVELKNGRDNKYDVTDLQQRFLDHIVDAGGYARVVYSFNEFNELIAEVLENN